MTNSLGLLNDFKRILRNIITNLSGTVIGLAIGLILMPIVIRSIGLTAFGVWALANSLVGYMGLLDVGLSPTLTKKSAEYLATENKKELNKTVNIVFLIYLLSGLTLGIAILLFGIFMPHVFKVSSDYIITFRIVILIVGLQAIIGFPMSIWKALLGGLEDYHIINGIGISSNLLRLIGTIYLIYLGYGLVSLVSLGLLLSLLSWTSSMLIVKHKIPYLRISITRFKFKEAKELLQFSSAMFISGIAGKTLQGADKIIIGIFMPVASISIYEVGSRISDYSRIILYNFLSVIIPAASAKKSTNQKESIEAIYLHGTKYLLITFGVIACSLFLFGKKFVFLWMGAGFHESVLVMYILIIGNLYQSQNVVAHAILIGTGKLAFFTKIMCLYPIVNIILSVVFVNLWDMIGVAIATTLTFFTLETWFLLYILKLFRVKFKTLFTCFYMPTFTTVLPATILVYYFSPFCDDNTWTSLTLNLLYFLSLSLIFFVLFGLKTQERRLLINNIRHTLGIN